MRHDPMSDTNRIHPSLPTAETLDAQQISRFPGWASAVRLERILERRREGWLDELVTYDAYFTVTYWDGELVRLEEFEGLASSSLLFTSADRVEAFLAMLPPEFRLHVKATAVTGAAFWRRFSQFAVDAVVVNLYGPSDHHTLRGDLGRELQIRAEKVR